MAEGGNSVVSIAEYTGVLSRWSRVIVAIVLLGALVGTGLVATQSGNYIAEAIVQVRPLVSQADDPNLDSARQIDVETEVAVASSQRVAENALALRTVAAQLGVTDLSAPAVASAAEGIVVDPVEAVEAVEKLTVRVQGDSQILVFEAATGDAGGAQALAQSTAIAYLDFRAEGATAGNRLSRTRLEERQQELIAQLGNQAGDGRAPAGAVLAYTEVAPRSELTAIGTKLANLGALSVDPGVVLTDASVPTATEGLPFVAGPVMGALLGLIGALTAVFLIDRTDDRIRSGRAELSALGVPMLGTAPVEVGRRSSGLSIDLDEVGPTSRLFAVNSSASDAYRRLQGSLLFKLDNDSKNVVLVAGVKDAAVATSVAANLGATAARSGRRTLLIGADLRNNRLGHHLGHPQREGLSDVVLNGVSLVDSIQPVSAVDNLGLLSAGRQLDRPADVLQSNAFARLMTAVQTEYDLVVVEAPPVLTVADAVDAATLCDGVVVVANGGSESRQSIAESVDQLRGVGSDIVGVVVADAIDDE